GGETVCGKQLLRDDPVRGEEGERPRDEGRDGCGFLVRMQFDEGEPRVVVDDRVRVFVANSGLGAHPAPRLLRAVAGDSVAGPGKARVGAGVPWRQVAGA